MFSRLFGPIERITFGLVSLTVSVILLATFLGIFPDSNAERAEARKMLCESVAMSFSSMANEVDAVQMESYFESIATRHPDIQSIGVRQAGGFQLLQIGDHFEHWKLGENEKSTTDEIAIPIYGDQTKWGTLEFRFQSFQSGWLWSVFRRPEIMLSAFVALVGMAVFYVYLRFVLRQLNPGRVIPNRVRDALDTLAEGLVVMDTREQIVLANKAFQESTGTSIEDVVGKPIQALGFFGAERASERYPWEVALNDGHAERNAILKSKRDNGIVTTFSVSCAPIFDEQGHNQGAIASFEDVTQLENKKNELQRMLAELDASSSEIRRQNRKLAFLATRDPLTSSMNRRSFFEKFDRTFASAVENAEPLSAFMVDIDHFKSINDNHGHAMGDDVLKAVAATLEEHARKSDVVCRYGGEEFSILLPNTDLDIAFGVAERIRVALERLKPRGLDITASLGVSSLSLGASSPQDLLEHADKCLYVAKRNGRNQVVRWDQVEDDIVVDESSISRTRKDESDDSNIPFHAVTALISALAYRDQETANHCRRVADLCVMIAEGLLPMRDCYVLEIAGLLHDIGKLGVPDSILLKPGQLTREEWQVLQMHERFGVELVRTTFDHSHLNEIICGSKLTHRQRVQEAKTVPLGSRILKIVDAYDSMTTNKPYRKGMTQQEAFIELRAHAGEQFDPELVERVIQILRLQRSENTAISETLMSKSAALNVGLQIESLSAAIDNRDKAGIHAIASRLQDTASKHGSTSIAEKASVIANELREDADLYELIRATNELLDECRIAQRALLVV